VILDPNSLWERIFAGVILELRWAMDKAMVWEVEFYNNMAPDLVQATGLRSVFPSFSAIFNRNMQKFPLFPCILIRNEGKTVQTQG
jgi:hypothetical protein